jgi:hypothetical protein
MPFNGNESAQITLAQGIAWTAAYRTEYPNEPRAHFFGKNKLLELLSQQDCVGIRAYYALDDNGNKQLILVGASADEEDQFNGILLDRSVPCTVSHSSSSPLTE